MHYKAHSGIAADEDGGFGIAVAVDFDGVGARVGFGDRTAVRYVYKLAVVGDYCGEAFYSAVAKGYACDYGGFFFCRQLGKFLELFLFAAHFVEEIYGVRQRIVA